MLNFNDLKYNKYSIYLKYKVRSHRHYFIIFLHVIVSISQAWRVIAIYMYSSSCQKEEEWTIIASWLPTCLSMCDYDNVKNCVVLLTRLQVLMVIMIYFFIKSNVTMYLHSIQKCIYIPSYWSTKFKSFTNYRYTTMYSYMYYKVQRGNLNSCSSMACHHKLVSHWPLLLLENTCAIVLPLIMPPLLRRLI